ncbi:hypothetical protein Q1695_000671 [Nippostrongylus brasiliensis]|nr:hypothetical protein Q1695_000671 [Nippostrongylus brasiliensis]
MIVIDSQYRTQTRNDAGEQCTDTDLNLLLIHAALYPVTYQRKLQLCAYPAKSPTYWFLLHAQKGSTPMVMVAQQGDSYDKATFLTALNLFMEETHLLKSEVQIQFGAEAHLMHEISQFLLHSDKRRPGLRQEHYVFFMTSEQMQNAQQIESSLPYGFELSTLTADDVEQIHRSSESKEPLETFRKRVECMPSSCIRQTSSGLIVSHELRSFTGAMVDQYTVPEYRRQGLGQAVEMDLAQKIIRLNETPFKLVPTYLTSILLSSQESPFWTMWSRNTLPSVQFSTGNQCLNFT